MKIQIITKKISKDSANKIAQNNYGEMVKGVTDIGKQIIALGAELHADAEAVSLKIWLQASRLVGLQSLSG